MENIFWTDSHAHIHNDEHGRTINDFFQEAVNNNVLRIITIGTDYNDSIKAMESTNQVENLYAAVGIHPESANAVSYTHLTLPTTSRV